MEPFAHLDASSLSCFVAPFQGYIIMRATIQGLFQSLQPLFVSRWYNEDVVVQGLDDF